MVNAWKVRKFKENMAFKKMFTKFSQKISTHLLPCGRWFCPVVSEPVKPYFTRFLRVLSFCLGVSYGVVFCGNGVVNGVVEMAKSNEI